MMQAHVRPWRQQDHQKTWGVLREGSFSNVWPSFVTITKRSSVRVLWASVALVCAASSATVWTTLLLTLAFPITLYMGCLAATAYFFYGPNFSDIRNIESTYFSSPDSHFWVAEVDGEVVGTIAVVRREDCHGAGMGKAACNQTPNSSQDETRGNIARNGDSLYHQLLESHHSSTNVAWLRRMAVKQNYRGLGIAKQLVRTVIEFCRQQKYDSVFLVTTEFHQPAKALYTNMGFKQLAFRPYKYLRGLITVWTYELELKL